MKYFKIYITFFAVIVMHSITAAQSKSADASLQITDIQMNMIKALGKELDQKIIVAFRSNPKLKKDMETDLKKLEEIKDYKLQKLEARKYQDKYLKLYNDILKSGKIDLVMYARKMEMIVPKYKFDVSSRNEITGQMRSLSENVTAVQAGPVVKKLTAFKQTISQNDCFVAAGGGIDFTSNSMKVKAVAAVAGGCYQSAQMETYDDMATEGFNIVNVKSKLNINGFAISVVGNSMCLGSVSCRFGPTPEEFKTIGEILLLAPFLWVGTVSDDFVQDDMFFYRPGRRIIFYSSSFSQSLIISEMHIESNLTDIEVTLTSQ